MVKVIDLLNKVKTNITLILGIIAAIFVGLFVFEKKKDEADKALKENAESKGKVEAINNQIGDLEKSVKEKEDEKPSEGDLLDFLNKPNSK